jgi:CRP-like cAMP-binding protein
MCMLTARSPTRTPAQMGNRFLQSLDPADLAPLLPHLEPVSMPFGAVLYEPGSSVGHVHFPTSSVVSILCDLDDRPSTEIAMTGNEGLVGIQLFMGGETIPGRAVVHSAGEGYRLASSVMKRAFAQGGHLQQRLLRYTQALMTQMALTVVCNRHHTIEQQLCRLLLLSLDRLDTNALAMTHDLIAGMLGVRREGVTHAARRLQDKGLIDYHRGHVTVLDRGKLERCVCECYEVVKREYDRLLRE